MMVHGVMCHLPCFLGSVFTTSIHCPQRSNQSPIQFNLSTSRTSRKYEPYHISANLLWRTTLGLSKVNSLNAIEVTILSLKAFSLVRLVLLKLAYSKDKAEKDSAAEFELFSKYATEADCEDVLKPLRG